MFDENNNIIPEQNSFVEDAAFVNETQAEPPVNQHFKYISPFYHQKRDLRRTAIGVGIPSLCLCAIGALWSTVYLFFTVKIANMSYSQAVELSQNPGMQQILQIIISCLMFLLPFGIAAKCMGLRIDQTVYFKKAKEGTFLPFLLFGIGFCAFSNIAMSYASAIFDSFGVDYEVDFGDSPNGFFGFLLSFIATAIVPALVEEFACRGIVLGMLKKHGDGFAVITSSIIFGVMHGNFDQIPFAVMVGLILGYIYIKTESIWTCVAVHFVNNAISVIFDYISNFTDNNTQNLLFIIYLIIALIAAILGVYILAKKQKEDYAINPPQNQEITEKQKYTWFFTAWPIVLFLVFNFIESLSYFVL